VCNFGLLFVVRFGFAVISDKTDVIAEVRKALNDEVLPRHLKFLETILERSATGWIASTSDVSIADFVIVPR
jgi:glutathione S-transferase